MLWSCVEFCGLLIAVYTALFQYFAVLCRFSVVRSYCGHGIGELFHCAPNIPHYAHNKVRALLSLQRSLLLRACCLVSMQKM